MGTWILIVVSLALQTTNKISQRWHHSYTTIPFFHTAMHTMVFQQRTVILYSPRIHIYKENRHTVYIYITVTSLHQDSPHLFVSELKVTETDGLYICPGQANNYDIWVYTHIPLYWQLQVLDNLTIQAKRKKKLNIHTHNTQTQSYFKP